MSVRRFRTSPSFAWILILICVSRSECFPVKDAARAGVSQARDKQHPAHSNGAADSSLAPSDSSRRGKQPDDELSRLIAEVFPETVDIHSIEGTNTSEARSQDDLDRIIEEIFPESKRSTVQADESTDKPLGALTLDLRDDREHATIDDQSPSTPSRPYLLPNLPSDSIGRNSNGGRKTAPQAARRTDVNRGIQNPKKLTRTAANDEASEQKTVGTTRVLSGASVGSGTRNAVANNGRAQCNGCAQSSGGDEVYFPSDDDEGDPEVYGEVNGGNSSVVPFFIINVPTRCPQGERFFKGRCRTFRP